MGFPLTIFCTILTSVYEDSVMNMTLSTIKGTNAIELLYRLKRGEDFSTNITREPGTTLQDR